MTQVKTGCQNTSKANGQSSARVLHVDDDEGLLEVAKEILRMEGNLEIDTAVSVDEAFKKIKANAFDVVVSDYEMPQKNGLQFLQELKEQKNDLPFIIFTGKGREEVAVKALNLGADGYYNKQGNPATVYGELAHGIRLAAERSKAKSALEESEKRYRTLMEQASEAIFVHDTKGKILDVNQQVCKNLRYTREELLSMNIREISPVAAKNKQMDEIWAKVVSGQPIIFESNEKRKDQSTFPVEVSLNSITFDKEKLVMAIVRDITERKQAETKIKHAYEEWQKTFDAINDLAYVVSKDFRLMKVNKAFCQFLKKEPEELIGKFCFEVLHKTEKPVLNCPHLETLSTGKATTREVNDSHLGMTFLISNSPIFDDKGELTGALHIAKNITDQKKTKELKESEERIRNVFNSLPDLVFFKDKEFKYVAANNALEQFFGLKPGEAVGKSDFDFMQKEAAQGCKETDIKALQLGFVSSEETVDGKVYSTIKQKVTDAAGNIIGIVGSIRDITERAQAEENLKKLKAFDERIINSLGDALLVIDPHDYSIININDAALKQIKMKREDVIGKSCYKVTHQQSTPCQPPNDICPIREVLETGKPITVEHIHIDENNNQRIVEVAARPVRNPEGKTVIIHVARDITERKQMETQIQQAERRYHTLFDQTPLGVLIIDTKTGVPVEFNEEAHCQLGYSREEFAKLSIYDYNVKETPREIRDIIKNILLEGKVEWETKHRTKNGEVRDVVVISQAIELSGKVVLHSIYRDVTEANRVKTALIESEAKYRMLVELAREGVWVLDDNYKTVFVNPRMAEILGYTESEMMGRDLVSFMKKRDTEFAVGNLESCKIDTKSQCEFIFVRQDGTTIFASVAASSIEDDEGNNVGTLALVSDISERKKAEEKLKESEKKYQTTFEASMDALMLLDEKGFFDCNKAALQLFGCKTVKEFTRYHPADLSPPTQPDGTPSMQSAMDHISEAFKKGMDSFFWLHKRVDGTIFPAEVLLTRMPLKDRNVLQATVRDITERKEAEAKLKANSDRIKMMNEKLRVVGSLSRHDVRNKLSAVTGYAYLLKKKHADQADIVEGVNKIEQAIRDSTKIFEFAKIYEQLGVEELTYIDTENMLNEAVSLFAGFNLKVSNECRGLTLLADSFLRQLFYNLIDNTMKYAKKATTIRVHYEKAEHGGLRLIYEDDGVGISAKNKTKLFSEGFSTGGSTGFGLFLIGKMMEVYGWQIQETGKPGKGVQFTMTIPKLNKSGKVNFQSTT